MGTGSTVRLAPAKLVGVWPRDVDWKELLFGVEIEFVGANPADVERRPGWVLDTGESQLLVDGESSGAELQSPKLSWRDREQIGETLARLRAAGGRVNWSCGLHVHVGLASWGVHILPALLDAALANQGALRELLRTPADRMLFCLPLSLAQRRAWDAAPGEDPIHHTGRPQSSRCGINVAAWYDHGTVEVRYPNATLDPDQVILTVELCLRWVAAVGAGRVLPGTTVSLAEALGVATTGYPPPNPEPLWHRRGELLNDLMIPVLQPLVSAEVPGAEILFVRPTADGFVVKTDSGERVNHLFLFRWSPSGLTLVSQREA